MRNQNLINYHIYPVILLAVSLFSLVLAEGSLLNPPGAIVILASVAVFATLFGSDASRWSLFCAAVLTIVFGHRGIYVGRWTFFIPLQVIIWLLFVRSILYTVLLRRFSHVRVPGTLLLLVGWTIFTAGVFLWRGQDWDTVISGISGILVGLPSFWVVQSYVTDWKRLNRILDIMLVVCLLMAILGILEFYFRDEVTSWAPWFFRAATIKTAEGFERAGFNFWGYPAAASVIAWGVLIGFHSIVRGYRESRWPVLAVLTIICGLIAVYISGQRSTWFGLGWGLAFLSLFSGPKGWAVAVLLSILLLSYVPGIFWERVSTVATLVSTGVPIDTSSAQRLARWDWGWQTMWANPLWGVGYGHWLTHNAFLEIGSSMGIFPVILFVLFIIKLMCRLLAVTFRGATPKARHGGELFLALSVTWLVQLNVETTLYNIVFSAPQWIMMALGWYLPEIASGDSSARTTGEHIANDKVSWGKTS